jgi:hypothetical protein
MLPAWMEIMMKKTFFVSALVQLLVFGVVGAFLLMGATMALLTFAFWHENPSADLFREMGEILLMVVPYAAVYTCSIGLVDFVLRSLRIPHRMLICVAAATGSMIWMIWMAGSLDQPIKLAGICLMAALSTALCSWLCSSFANRTSPPADLMTPSVSTASPG